MKVTVRKTRLVLDLSNKEVEALASLWRTVERDRSQHPATWDLNKSMATINFMGQLTGLLAAFDDFRARNPHGVYSNEELAYSPSFAGTLEKAKRALVSVRGRYKGEKGTQARVSFEAVKAERKRS